MDTEILVSNQIEAGRTFIEALKSEGFPLSSVFWVETSEEGIWFLYIVTEIVETKGLASSYSEVYRILQLDPDPWLRASDIKLIGPDNPIAMDVSAVRNHWPADRDVRHRGPQLGSMAIEEAYIYAL